MTTVVSQLAHLPAGRFGPDERVIALTFDDGPGPWTPAVADTLARLGVPATFFVVGSLADADHEQVEELVAAGHTVAGHSWSHGYGESMDDGQVVDESLRTAELLEEITGGPAPFVRPPYKKRDAPRYAELLDGHGLTTVTWSVDPRDWATSEPVEIAVGVLDNLHCGAIVVLHDGGGDRAATVEALPLIVQGASLAGYRFVSL